ncbi:putative Ig domain-containing protein, partial [Ascidiaceihabitans sp.]|nr:putative Ig domain-containing protein [Ascidiaceihabitans sp.]
MSKINLRKSARNLSPLSLLVLAACGGEESFTSGPVLGPGSANGFVNKGPLSNALVYADYDDPTLGNSDSVRTGADGSYALTTLNNNYTIVAVTDGSTIDTSSGTVLSGVTLKAPSGATVVTPTSTLMEEGGLTASQVMEVLGLPEGVDPLTFNAFAAGVSAADALAVEKASQQIMSVVNAFAAAAEGSGASQSDAFEVALSSVAEVVKTKAAKLTDESASDADKTLDLSNATDLALIQAEITTAVTAVDGVDVAAFGRVANDTATAVQNVNTKIEAVTDLSSDASKNVFSTTQVLAEQVKTATEAEVATAGSGSIEFKNSSKVDEAASNAAPTAISLSSNVISEAASSLVVGTLSTVDDDQPDGAAFVYTIAEIAGTDFAAFEIDQDSGQLSLKEQPDYEAKEFYSVTVLSTDAGGKTLSQSFAVKVTDENEAPTVANAIADQTIAEDSALSFQFNSNVFADVDVGDSLTYTATLSDGSALPSWLAFNAATRTFSGTPLNANVGVIAVKVTATDSGNGAVIDTFDVTVTNTSDAMVTFVINPALSDGLGQVIDQDLDNLGYKVENFYNDPNTGILAMLDALDSETFGSAPEDISVSSNGINIKNTEGYVLNLKFSNFSPNSLQELYALSENFSGDISDLNLNGGFEKIALTDPDGNEMIELSHSSEGISWRNLKANDGEIDAFVIEGTFNNQLSDYIQVVSQLASSQETNTEAVL